MTLASGKHLVIIPSLRISGGIQEALLLAEQLMLRGVQIQILCLWKSANEAAHDHLPVDYLSEFTTNKLVALFQYPALFIRFLRYLQKNRTSNCPSLILTHFSTFPFAWLAPSLRWFCFNQDIEWMFVPRGPLRYLLRWFILKTSRRAYVITANSFIESKFIEEGIFSIAQVSIWPNGDWLSEETPTARPFDVAMLLRKNSWKRVDLYLELLSQLEIVLNQRCAIITPESEIYSMVKDQVSFALLLPSTDEIMNLYLQSKIFVLLSDTEGFGLTALEAMGQGCIPICRDCGGVRCYMIDSMLANLFPLSEPLQTIVARIESLLADPLELAINSRAAQTIFRDGLSKSNAQRHTALDLLAKTLLE